MFRELSKKSKEFGKDECIQLLKSENRGVLSVLGDDDYPYGMPMNHWYNEKDGNIYFHTGLVGHRTDALEKHNKVSYCVFNEGYKNEGEWAYNVKSVIVFGKMEMLTDPEVITEVATDLSYKFTDDTEYITREIAENIDHTLILKLVPEHICGKNVKEE